MAERLTVNQNVAGSSPARGASKLRFVSAFCFSTPCVAFDVERRSSCCEGFERVFRDCMCVTSSLFHTIRLQTALHPTISYSHAFCLTDSYTCYASFYAQSGFTRGISVARIDFTHKVKAPSYRSDALTHTSQRNQLEPTEQHPSPNPAKPQESL